MKKNLLVLAGAAAIALGLGACAYDPYYSGNTRQSVSVGYGYGHGYGGSSFSTSYFWSTGNSGWGYDPYVRCYYDYGRRAYYDPYLYGYYPVGFRPRVLVGVPHPSGYRQGWCPPPRRVTNVTVNNYRNRESAYRNSNHNWSRNVRYDRTPQVSQAPRPNRTRKDGTHLGGSAPTRGGYIHSGGNRGAQSQWGGNSNNRNVRPAPGSNWQPRTSNARPPEPRSSRASQTRSNELRANELRANEPRSSQPRSSQPRSPEPRPTFGAVPDNQRQVPNSNRGGSRAQQSEGRPIPAQRAAPAPRENKQRAEDNEQGGGRGNNSGRQRNR